MKHYGRCDLRQCGCGRHRNRRVVSVRPAVAPCENADASAVSQRRVVARPREQNSNLMVPAMQPEELAPAFCLPGNQIKPPAELQLHRRCAYQI